MESVPPFDVSSEDDLLIPSSSLELGLHAACTLDAENMEKASKYVEHVPQLSESLKQNPKRPDKYNLRKSLAWDSAFFTCEGILNSKELEIMNSTYSKAMRPALPGIQEELRKSSESTCTLDSESLALEQPGLNLFENVRDSIQKSLGSNNQTPKMIHFGNTKKSKLADAPCVRTLKKVDISSQKPSHEKGVSKPSLRPPKVASKTNRPTVMPAQISSFAITTRKAHWMKHSPVISSIRPDSKPIDSLLTPIQGATAKQQPAVAFSNANEVQNIAHRSSSLTRSIIAGSPRTDPVLAAIVKKRGAEKNTVHSSSRASKTYLKTSSTGLAKNHVSNLPRSSSLVLSKVSPASSIDSIESSSSTSTYRMLARSLRGSDASSQNSDSLSQTNTDDPTKSCVNSGDTVAKTAKPSALRVPRPTVGYFDKEKAKIHRTNKVLKPGLQYDLKAGVHAIATANKIKPCNIPTLRDGALPSAPSKQGTCSAEVQVVHMKIENHQVLSPKVDNFSFEIAEENHRINLKAGRGPDDRLEKVKKTCNRSKKEISSLLQPRPFAPVNEIHTTGKLRTHDQLSYTLQVQLENVNNDLGALHC